MSQVCYVTKDNVLYNEKNFASQELSHDWLRANGEWLSGDGYIEEVAPSNFVLAYNTYNYLVYLTKIENISVSNKVSECDGPISLRGEFHYYSVSIDSIRNELLSRAVFDSEIGDH